ncbi:hypothetical protein [Achromobacter sp. ACRQX]|uniref:hypothetical protein n=1 Tax=Achromobacter sp. ACRQX TaxID=2918181 RepID=UPI001EF173D2|nr:hypothetical protein [Achromobacter sp. ACRQX]MCG7326856.1 hypothetical protein [Achromobacter sp. ACRQX]
MAVDFSSIALFPGRRTDARSGARWQCNLSGKRPSIAYGEHIEVRFNDGRIEPDHPNHVWDTRAGDHERFVGFFRVVGRNPIPTTQPAPAGVTTEGAEAGS